MDFSHLQRYKEANLVNLVADGFTKFDFSLSDCSKVFHVVPNFVANIFRDDFVGTHFLGIFNLFSLGSPLSLKK